MAQLPVDMPVKSGSVTLGKGKSKRKKHYMKLFKASDNGLARLEIYEDEKSSTLGVPTDLIVAGDVVRIVHDAGKEKKEHMFAILTKEKNTYMIAVSAHDIRSDWTKHINSILFQAVPNNRVSQSLSRKNTTTDNDIYDSAEEYLRDFHVKVSDETSKRLFIQSSCRVKLMVESGNITVISQDGNLIGRWGIEHLRRFGYSDNDFHFEAGRKSDLGPGLFSFKTEKGKSIHMTVTREKHEVRGNRVGSQGETEPPRPGVQQDLMQFDGHCYEEINVTQKHIQPSVPGTIPLKPSRGAINPPPQSPMTKAPPPGTFHNNAAAAGGAVYTEITPTKNAWKKHGRDVEDDNQDGDPIYEEGGGCYDSLNHARTGSLTPANPESDNYIDSTVYRAEAVHEAPVVQRQTSEVIAPPADAIYAEINPSTKIKNKKPKE